MRALVLAFVLSALSGCGVFEPAFWVSYGNAAGLGVEGDATHVFGEQDYPVWSVMAGGTWRRGVAPQPHPLDLATRAVRLPAAPAPITPAPRERPAREPSAPEEDPHEGHGLAVDVMEWFTKTEWGGGQIAALALLVLGAGFAAWAAVAYWRRRNGKPKTPPPAG